jgi:hypothetical protein
MNIQEILRGLLDIVERGQSEQDDIDQANLEMTPVIDTQEISLPAAEVEFDAEQGIDGGCGDEMMGDFPELDVVKRNAGMPVVAVITDGPGSVI